MIIMLKRVKCVFLSVIICCLAFSGCGDNKTESTYSIDSDTDNISSDNGGFDIDDSGNTASAGNIYNNIITDGDTDLSDINKSDVYTGRATDLKGKTILIQGWGSGSTKLTGTGIIPQRANDLISSIEKTLNCVIEIVSSNGGYNSESFSGLAAGKPTADIIFLSKKDLLSNYAYNRLVELDTLNVFDFSDRSSYSSATELARLNGHYYGVAPRTYGTISFYTASCIFANIDVLSKSGITIDDLTGWVENKEWTWDKMREVAEMVKNAGYTFMYDGTTSADNEREHSLYGSLLASVGADWVDMEDGTLSFSGDSEIAVEALDFYKSLYDGGYVKQVTSGIEKFGEGDSAMLAAAMYTPNFNERSVSWGNYTILPLPLGSEQSEYTFATGDYTFSAIGRGTKPSGLSDAEIATVLNLMNTCLISESENESLVVSESIGWAKNALAQYTVDLYNTINSANSFKVTWSGMILTRENSDLMWLDDVFKFASGNLSKQQILAQSSSYNTILNNFLDR